MKVGAICLIFLAIAALQFLAPTSDRKIQVTGNSLVAEIMSVDTDSQFPEAMEPHCLNPRTELPSEIPDYPARLIIDVDQLRQWTKNTFEAWIALGKFGGIVEEFKNDYDATVTFEYANGIRCTDRAHVRLHGDGYDHIRTFNGLQTSLDVRLDTSNLAGITNFKLFLPETRNGDNEVFATTLFEELGFLTPRTFYIDATVNGFDLRYLVQEKFRKELLEAQEIPESPIFQVDERFGYIWTEHSDAGDVIVNPHIFTTARLSNKTFAERGPVAISVVEEGLARLNQVYAQLAAAKPGAVRVDQLPGVVPGTDTPVSRIVSSSALPILGISDPTEPSEASRFTALFLAMGSDNAHGLKSHNQRFVYDPWLGTVRPIYYDGQFSLIQRELPADSRAKQWLKQKIGFVEHEFTPDTDLSLARVTPATAAAAMVLQNELASINVASFSRRLAERGASISDTDLIHLIGTGGIIERNLTLIASSSKVIAPDYVPAELFKDIYDPSIRLVFGTIPSGGFSQCTLFEGDCEDLALSNEQQISLLSGDLTIESIEYIYVGNSTTNYAEGLVQPDSFAGHWQHNEFVGGTTLSTTGLVSIEIDYANNILRLVASSPSARAVIWDGTLTDWLVSFQGLAPSLTDYAQTMERSDWRGISGCLTFRDIDLTNVRVTVAGGDCEDGVHFVRAFGSVNTLDVSDTRLDAIDMDYSDLDVSDIVVRGAGNDCLDVSDGYYRFNTVSVKDCADKALSVGESSMVRLHSLRVVAAPIGISSKDSSIAIIDQANLIDVDICGTVYRKKQAYRGGTLLLEKSTCDSEDYRQQQGSQILVNTP